MKDTIFALATAIASSIAVIRISGKDSLSAIKKIFPVKKEMESHKMNYGKIVFDGQVVDEVYVVYFKGPRSYTGEDIVEIQCHASQPVIKQLLHILSLIGLRYAQPGEFTKRAFFNNKLSLTQAEAVMDLISASSEKSSKSALDQMEGSLNSSLNIIRDNLTDCIASLEAQIDYPDEELFDDFNEVKVNIINIKEQIKKLIISYNEGIIIKDGLKVVLAGKPNAGKSSLFNALLGVKRAIVTDIPGTTRDALQERIIINGVPIVLIDTAGLRDTEQEIEQIGIDIANEQIKKADLVLYVVDKTDINSFDKIEDIIKSETDILVFSKDDIEDDSHLIESIVSNIDIPYVRISSTENWGLEELKKIIFDFIENQKQLDYSGPIITNARHQQALKNCMEYLTSAIDAFDNMDIDCVTIDLRAALNYFGEINGETLDEEIIDKIFSKFCLGK